MLTKKKMWFICVAIFILLSTLLTGCGENYPLVKVRQGEMSSFVDICIGKPYKYDGFDIQTLDNGDKELILHFRINDEK